MWTDCIEKVTIQKEFIIALIEIPSPEIELSSPAENRG